MNTNLTSDYIYFNFFLGMKISLSSFFLTQSVGLCVEHVIGKSKWENHL